jgi:3D (Asp-Asp-Asp) domain-containing protein
MMGATECGGGSSIQGGASSGQPNADDPHDSATDPNGSSTSTGATEPGGGSGSDDFPVGSDEPHDDASESGTLQRGEACSSDSACVQGLTCTAGECIEDGDFRITLIWDEPVDLDLHVTTPLDEELYYRHRNGDQGGEFQKDGCISGDCETAGGSLMESVVWDSMPTGNPDNGDRTYDFWATNYDGTSSASVRFEVKIGDRVESFSGHVAADIDATSDTFVVSLDAPGEGEPFVAFTSPGDGSTVENPVEFEFETGNVHAVILEADDYPLADAPWDPSERSSLPYTFNGTGYEREVVLTGFDTDGQAVAEDTITITIGANRPDDPGRYLGTFWNTYYYFAQEQEYSGPESTVLYDASCHAIANVPASFSDDVCVQGSGKLDDGRFINFSTTCSCGRSCPTGGTICYQEIDSNRYPYGRGSRDNAVEPLRTFAVDTSVIPWGTILYVPEWDGVQIPQIGSIGGFTHDGCFHAGDVGGWINGNHFDFFAGTSSMHDALEMIHPTRSEFEVYTDSPRCDHFQPQP